MADNFQTNYREQKSDCHVQRWKALIHFHQLIRSSLPYTAINSVVGFHTRIHTCLSFKAHKSLRHCLQSVLGSSGSISSTTFWREQYTQIGIRPHLDNMYFLFVKSCKRIVIFCVWSDKIDTINRFKHKKFTALIIFIGRSLSILIKIHLSFQCHTIKKNSNYDVIPRCVIE